MRRAFGPACWLCLALAPLAGCQSTLSALRGQTQMAATQQEILQQNQQLQARLNSLNISDSHSNQMLAQAQQRTQVAESERDALREQLRAATAHIRRLQTEQLASQRKYDNLRASTRRQGVVIEPNNSWQDQLPGFDIPGVRVRRDGERVRVEIAAARLFATDDDRLTGSGGKLLEAVADELDRKYAGRHVGIETYSNLSPTGANRWADGQQLSRARASVVLDHLSRNSRLPQDRLSIAGQSADGRGSDRVELVVYPRD